MITQDTVTKLFDYSDGCLVRKRTGRSTGTKPTKDEYYRVFINHKSYYLHTVVYLFHTGQYVTGLDHIDQNKHNNRIENLRIADRVQNGANRKGWSKQKLYKGVYKSNQRYKVVVGSKGNTRHLGTYDCPIVAATVYDLYAIATFGEYAHTNFTYKREQLAL